MTPRAFAGGKPITGIEADGHLTGAAVDAAGYGETPWRSASRTMSTRPFAPSLARMCEI